MDKLVKKFENLIRTLNYNQLKLGVLNVEEIKAFSIKEMPLVIDQLDPLGWDLSKDSTWTETVFLNVKMSWYGKNVGLYLTPSIIDFNKGSQVVATKCFSRLRTRLGLDCHAIVLLDPTIFLELEDLDLIYLSFDFDRGYSSIDFSHYNEDEDLEDQYKDEWGWLVSNEETDYLRELKLSRILDKRYE